MDAARPETSTTAPVIVDPGAGKPGAGKPGAGRTVGGSVHQDRDWLYRLALRLVRNTADAEDLAQDTWLAALRNPPPAEDTRRAWLRTTARRLAARRRRRLREDPLDHEPSGADAPERDAQLADARRTLEEAIASIPPDDQRNLRWRWADELTYSEIGDRLGITRQSATAQVERSVERLRKSLAERHRGEPLIGILAPLVPPLRKRPRGKTFITGLASAASVALVGSASWALFATSPPAAIAPTGTVLAAPAAQDSTHVLRPIVATSGTELRTVSATSAITPRATSPAVAPRGTPTSSQPALAVSVVGSVSIDGEPPIGWEAWLCALEQGALTAHADGGIVPIENGEFEVHGYEPGPFELWVVEEGSEARTGFVREYVLNGTQALSLVIETGGLTVHAGEHERLLAITTVADGDYLQYSESSDGIHTFEAVAAGQARVLAIHPHGFGDGEQLAVVAITAGQEHTIHLD